MEEVSLQLSCSAGVLVSDHEDDGDGEGEGPDEDYFPPIERGEESCYGLYGWHGWHGGMLLVAPAFSFSF